MNVVRLGGWFLGAIMLATGLAVLASDIDPLVLCFKQCDLPRAVRSLIGPGLLRVVVGIFFLVLAALFLLPLAGATNRRSKPE